MHYSLVSDSWGKEEVKAINKVIKSNIYTYKGKYVKEFENKFARYFKTKYAVMVNSGSSANLLSAFALINPKKENRLRYGDKFLIPAICWSTSLWPFIQSGLKPVFTDVSKKDFCIQVDELDNKKLKAIKLIVSINILGNSPDIKNLSNICKKKNIYLVEDTCEALGSKMNSKSLGTYGDFGTFSFYYSHQITSGEGGMVVCNKKEDYEILRTLRAHGWDRHVKNRKQNTFNFVNSGFNLRPLDITAAIGISQLKRLNEMKKIRNLNKVKIISCIKNHPEWNDQYEFFEARKGLSPSWFGFPILLNKKYRQKKILLMKYLNKNKIETRPILSGNFLNQPSVSLYNLKPKKNFNNAQEIEERGFFIGIPTTVLTNQKINYLVKKLMFIERI